MDMLMIDVTGINCETGDEVTFFDLLNQLKILPDLGIP
jgi:alanine racemase